MLMQHYCGRSSVSVSRNGNAFVAVHVLLVQAHIMQAKVNLGPFESCRHLSRHGFRRMRMHLWQRMCILILAHIMQAIANLGRFGSRRNMSRHGFQRGVYYHSLPRAKPTTKTSNRLKRLTHLRRFSGCQWWSNQTRR